MEKGLESNFFHQLNYNVFSSYPGRKRESGIFGLGIMMKNSRSAPWTENCPAHSSGGNFHNFSCPR